MREMWNEKFSREGFLYGTEANNFIKENFKFIKNGSKILCLGEGEGRNAVFLAKKGFEVTALDASDIGLSKLEKLASEAKVEIHTEHMLISQWQTEEKYDSVISTFMHLHISEQREMFTKTIDALNEGGFFIAEFFSTSQLDFDSGCPRNADLLYKLDDMYQLFSNLPCEIYKLSQEIIHLKEGRGHNGEASVIRIIVKKKN